LLDTGEGVVAVRRTEVADPGAPKVVRRSADTWLALLDSVAQGNCEIIIKSASAGRAVVVSEQTLADLRRRAGEASDRADSTPLSPRELEVLALAAKGHTGVTIANMLGLAVNTVAQHLVSARRKLGVRTTRAAVEAVRATHDLA
jgi:DNA-binding NarL/FixJ family response regulator